MAQMPLVQLARPSRAPRTPVTFTIDGQSCTVEEGTTILRAAESLGLSIPTLCYLETLEPVNACRLCVVEVEGARVLAPACSRAAEEGMKVHTASARVRHARRLVLELLASSVDLSTAPGLAELIEEYEAQPARFGEAAAPSNAGVRDAHIPGHHVVAEPGTAATVAQPVKVDNTLYVRDYAKCVLCWRCVQVCAEDAQYTFALTFDGRGFETQIGTFYDSAMPQTTCVFCGQCVGVCPTNALKPRREWLLEQGKTPDEIMELSRSERRRRRR